MAQEERNLLVQDLCTRLPYGVKTSYSGHEMTIRGIDVESKTVDVIDWGKARFAAVCIDKIKPYLRPLSSMTEEEEKQFQDVNLYELPYMVEGLDWLNANHFDYRGLIEKELALEAPEGMYKKEIEL